MQSADKLITLPDHEPIDVEGNRLELIGDCDERLGRYLQLLNEARTTIEIIIYVFEDDEAGVAVRSALVDAAGRGVAVRMVIDSFGCNLTSDEFFQPLRDAGIEVEFFSRRWRTSYLIRNHQKMLIIDRETLLFGGFNLSQCYFEGCAITGWTDLGLQLTGPAAAGMVDWFERLFQFTKTSDGKWLRLRRMIRDWQRANAPQGQFQWLVGGPTQRLSPWARAVRTDLTVARRVDMVMAYFSPGQGMLRRMARTARRGSMRLVTAARSDNGATIGAARLLYSYLVRRNVKVYEYQPQRLHMKLVVADDAVYIGSANFDMRSLFVNLEVMLRVEDAALATQARRLVDALTESSEAITPTWIRKHKTWLSRLRWMMSWFVVSTIDYSVVRRLNFGLEKDPEIESV